MRKRYFRKGDRVKIVCGKFAGRTGTVELNYPYVFPGSAILVKGKLTHWIPADRLRIISRNKKAHHPLTNFFTK